MELKNTLTFKNISLLNCKQMQMKQFFTFNCHKAKNNVVPE